MPGATDSWSNPLSQLWSMFLRGGLKYNPPNLSQPSDISKLPLLRGEIPYFPGSSLDRINSDFNIIKSAGPGPYSKDSVPRMILDKWLKNISESTEAEQAAHDAKELESMIGGVEDISKVKTTPSPENNEWDELRKWLGY